MRPTLTASALLALVLALTATGQPPAKLDPPKKADKVDPTAAAIASALANDPDVKMAQAKMQLAEAELVKARQVTTLKILSLKAKIDQAKADLAFAEEQLRVAEQRVQAAVAPQSELLGARGRYETAKAALATAESEWKFLTAAPDPDSLKAIENGLRWLRLNQDRRELSLAEALSQARAASAIKGPIPERLRAALDKSVKLGPKGQAVPLSKALEVFRKDAGMDVPFRSLPVPDPEIVSEGEELPIGAWLQLYQDTARLTFYVREYGLLAANKQTAPPDAPTITEFWKQKPSATEPKPESKPEPLPDPLPEPKPK